MLSKDLAQVPGRKFILRVAAKQKRGGKERQTLSSPLFPFQGESTHFSTPISPTPQTSPALLPASPYTHTYKAALSQISSSDASQPQTPVTLCHSPTVSLTIIITQVTKPAPQCSPLKEQF